LEVRGDDDDEPEDVAASVETPFGEWEEVAAKGLFSLDVRKLIAHQETGDDDTLNFAAKFDSALVWHPWNGTGGIDIPLV